MTDNDGIGNPFASLHYRLAGQFGAAAEQVQYLAHAFIAARDWEQLWAVIRMGRRIGRLSDGDLLSGIAFADYQTTVRLPDRIAPSGEILETDEVFDELQEQARGFLGEERLALALGSDCIAIETGDRVCGGDGDGDGYDEGLVLAVDGGDVTVGWDSGVRTTQPACLLRRRGGFLGED